MTAPRPGVARAELSKIARATRPHQTLRDLRRSIEEVRELAAAWGNGHDSPNSSVHRLGGAVTSIVEQLKVKAEIPPGEAGVQRMKELEARAERGGVDVVDVLCAEALEVEQRNVGYIGLAID